MARGYIKLHRDIVNNWLWDDKPFSRGQAWVDLLIMANYKTAKEVYRGQLVERKRGEVHCALSYLATRWGWSRGKVNRFMAMLKQDNMITINSTTHDTTITIENYGKWQDSRTTDSTTDDTTDGTTDGQQTVQQTDTQKKYKNDKESMNKTKEVGAPPGRMETPEEVKRRLNEVREQIQRAKERWNYESSNYSR